MEKVVPPNPKALSEALKLSEEILRNIELTEIPLSQIALKACRLARLLNDFDYQMIMEYEAGGYPTTPNGVPQDVFQLGIKAQRNFKIKAKDDDLEDRIHLNSIEQIEQEIKSAEIGLDAARDRDVSISSSNPHQVVSAPIGNVFERNRLRTEIANNASLLASRRSFIYNYVLRINHGLKFSNLASDAFSRKRESVDALIGTYVPNATEKFTAIYENLSSENTEDWSNAVHSCRRILQDLAEVVFPSQSEDRMIEQAGKSIPVKLGKENYINRLVCFVQDKASSKRFEEIIGSHIRFMGDRLDSIFHASQKGSHDVILTKDEADRYVIYTYMIVGDILSLISDS